MRGTGTNSESMQARNRSLVLRLLLRGGILTRSELAESTGLTQASISKIASELIESGLIIEGDVSIGKMGRRTIDLQLNGSFCNIVAVKIARTSISVAVFSISCRLLESKTVNFDAVNDSPHEVLDSVIRTAHEFIYRYGNVKAVGIAVPGPYLVYQGRIALMSRFDGWGNINIREILNSAFDIPVIIEHDSNASAFAEWCYGTNEEFKKEGGVLLSVYAGEGIGAGLVVDGNIFRGAYGTAVEIGHMSINRMGPRCQCGNRGCLELYCSSAALATSVSAQIHEHPESTLHNEKVINAGNVFKHMRKGDYYATEKVRQCGRYLGYGLANATYLYNPSKIVITDIMTGGGSIFLDAVKSSIKERVLPELYNRLKIELTALKTDPVLLGCAAIAAESLFEQSRELN